jgi:hypothetical protein
LLQYSAATPCPCLPMQDQDNPDHLSSVLILEPDQKWWTGAIFELPHF